MARRRRAAGARADRVRRGLLESGGGATLAALKAGPEAVDDLIAYLEPHADHTDYPRRLREGRSIGSGMVEGVPQDGGRPEAEADRRPLARSQGRADGVALLRGLRGPAGCLLE